MNINRFFSNSKNLMKLAYPILIAQLIQNLMGFADTVMAGRVSATDMAAVAVASSVWLPLILTISGLVMALASIISQLSGGKKFDDVAKASYQTAWIAVFFSIIIIALYYIATPLLIDSISLEPELKQLMFDYLGYIVWGGPGYCLYLVLRNYSEGLSFTRPTMIISIIGLLINIPANYIFIYGEFGMPALGGAGCGIATAIVYWVMFAGMLAYAYFSKHLKQAPLFTKFYWPDWQEIKTILALGMPIAFSLLFEVSLFAAVAIILVPFGANVVASHQIAINFSGLVFMVPLSLAMAVTIKVGFEVGNKNLEKAKELCRYSVILGLIIAVATAALTLLFSKEIAAIYTIDKEVLDLAASLMFLAALFQFSDAIQVISAGALRGYKDTKSILYITFFSYWIVGLSLGLILGLTDWIVPATGPYGFWIGFIVGLTVAAVLLAWRLKVVQNRLEQQVALES
ncbi:MATE family efflux transporter [Colwellia sp. Arc7-635]|jgi:MATE family multidrug resistance protein|uniref:MATE family efflux transporter n=1 Tax=Colwellia sp. Arc7-635 TaxID=2497879 RepID=UPI000F852C3F|nr:MATE family efflux transporter [Colwellia sp. Arc7-635]AZQ83736.1 MATE family efflux transporter [Colwellia sp. Arc7-635]